MKGLFFIRTDELKQQPGHPQMDALKLLAKQGKLEIMHQHILRGATVWLTPSSTPDELEFFYIISGTICFSSGDGDVTLHAGDSFHAQNLNEDIVLTITEDTDLLYVSTMPVFDESATYQAELFSLLRQIDAKDHYTLQHSVNVRNYSLQLWRAFPERQTASFGDLVIASLFHDVGKCRIADDILKKPGRFTPEEFDIMKTHAAMSGELLAAHLPGNAVLFAAQHHERLDGSGYPHHITAEHLPFESRVIALADAFDAMTTSRIYSSPRPMVDAAQELCSLPHLYDAEIAAKLLELVRSSQVVSNQPVKL